MSDAPNTDKTFEDHNQELLDLVDSNDNVIGQIERAEVSTLEPNTGKFVRCIEAIIMRSNGDVWVPVRSQTKRIAPGGYDYGVAGHVPSGETYERAVILEAQEEAGLVLEEDNAILIEHQLPSESNGPYFSNFYLIRTDSAPALSDEHTSGSWMSLDALAEKLHSGMPAKPSLLSNVERLQEYLKKRKGNNMEFNYCRRCGTGLKQIAPTAYKCAKGHSIFSNPVPTVGVFILTDDDKVMLAVRGIEPHKGMLDTFGGFLDGPETIEEALAREMNEELGLSPEQYEPAVSLGSGKGRYPFEGEPYPVVTSYFYTHLVGNANPVPADDVADIRIVDLDNLDMSELHDDDVRTGVMLLKQALAKEYVA